ncbi:class I SAM-dependent methyltransferase [Thalassospira sp. MCCC 1A01428]|uniref:class I SAM-dependent DNA methyltransferase n=1 Tax=Thalassospira sp. MCCC 1A01428 TaxID=1470575 RepID=UPI000A1DD45E|nr:class I SAM-dependent methyltransferase [Thalassospira sp. MCCC 1A01428]OSQ42236.1 methyltransferase type 11 [Thalassospira sp. MCCC 1A01428]
MVDASDGNTSHNSVSDTASDLVNMTHASPDALAAYYDKWATSYEKDLLAMGYRAPAEAAKLIRQHGIATNNPILDAGCGTGLTGLELSNQGYSHITGIDISPESLKQAKTKGCYQTLKIQNMNQQLDFANDSFAAAQCIGALTYVDNIEGLMREFSRLVQAGGIIVFSHRVDLYDGKFANTLQALDDDGTWSLIDHSPPRPYIPDHADFGDEKTIHYDIYRVH